MTTGSTTRWRPSVAATVLVAFGVLVLFGAGVLTGRAIRTPSPAGPGAVDIGFCQDMAAHHAQAVTMAEDALSRSTTPEILAVAREILVTQAQERGTMAGWLTAWHAPQLPSGPPMTWMPGMPSSTTMPGMATQAELDRLGTTTGKAFDVLFLQLMIRHHDGGILMAEYARDHATLPDVRALAGSEVLDQYQENAIMASRLSADGGTALPLH